MTERLRGTNTKLLWHQINCKLNESTVSECNLHSESSKRSSESSLDSQFHRLVKQVSSASTDHTLDSIVVHLRDTFVRIYSKCDGHQSKEKYCEFQVDWHKHCSAFLLEKSLSMDTVGIPESENRDLAGRHKEWIEFCEPVAANEEARNRVMELCAAVYLPSAKFLSSRDHC